MVSWRDCTPQAQRIVTRFKFNPHMLATLQRDQKSRPGRSRRFCALDMGIESLRLREKRTGRQIVMPGSGPVILTRLISGATFRRTL